jgi:hypothetical protein
MHSHTHILCCNWYISRHSHSNIMIKFVTPGSEFSRLPRHTTNRGVGFVSWRPKCSSSEIGASLYDTIFSLLLNTHIYILRPKRVSLIQIYGKDNVFVRYEVTLYTNTHSCLQPTAVDRHAGIRAKRGQLRNSNDASFLCMPWRLILVSLLFVLSELVHLTGHVNRVSVCRL